MRPQICHLDADCFYVSAERVRDPALRHVPAGVLGNQGACVIAKSYEAKAAGVKTGMPIWDAVKLCPEGIFIKRDFRWYEVLSRQMLELLRTISPAVEYYSIDEMFFDAGQLSAAFSLPLPDAAKALQRRILDEIGVPVSMGISFTKSLAKLISDTAKPFGCGILIDHAEIFPYLQTRAVEDISGIGERSRRKLAEHAIITCLDFVRADRKLIQKLLTITGECRWYELRGEPIQKILTQRPKHKCIGRGGSLGGATTDMARLVGWVVRNTERLIEELDFHGVFTSQLAFAIEFKEGGGWSGRVVFHQPTATFHDIATAGKDMLDIAYRAETRRVSHMHIMAERLSERQTVQGSLFPNVETPAEVRVAEVKREINDRLGRYLVRSGDTLALQDIYDDAEQSYDICDIRGKICF
jgi:nucleotidyltransferase/DNA polymerase involved in DNA repair